MYRQGKWPEAPEGIKNQKAFRATIRSWVRIEENSGAEVLKHKNKIKYGLRKNDMNWLRK